MEGGVVLVHGPAQGAAALAPVVDLEFGERGVQALLVEPGLAALQSERGQPEASRRGVRGAAEVGVRSSTAGAYGSAWGRGNSADGGGEVPVGEKNVGRLGGMGRMLQWIKAAHRW